MAILNSTVAATNDAAYVSGNHLADVSMFISSAMRLVEKSDTDAYCLLEIALREIIAAQDYLEAMDPIKSPISSDVAEMLGRVGKPH